MYGYRDFSVRTACAHSNFYCPYSTYPIQCPLANQYRPKVEEYAIQQQAAPKNPPPNYTPKLSEVPPLKPPVVHIRVIGPCLLKYTYLWPKKGDSFWSYITYVSRKDIQGWKYVSGQWVSFTLKLKEIENFVCI